MPCWKIDPMPKPAAREPTTMPSISHGTLGSAFRVIWKTSHTWWYQRRFLTLGLVGSDGAEDEDRAMVKHSLPVTGPRTVVPRLWICGLRTPPLWTASGETGRHALIGGWPCSDVSLVRRSRAPRSPSDSHPGWSIRAAVRPWPAIVPAAW